MFYRQIFNGHGTLTNMLVQISFDETLWQNDSIATVSGKMVLSNTEMEITKRKAQKHLGLDN